MNRWPVAALLSGLIFFAAPAVRAQTGPTVPDRAQGNSEAGARRNGAANAQELARNQRRAAMSPDEIKRDQQLELLEARTGNTSFGGRNGSPERQFDSNRNGGGFMVRKFKDRSGLKEHKRGSSHAMGGSNPAGKPLVHNRGHKRKFLLF